MSSTSAGGIAFQLRYFVQISPPKSPVCHSEECCGLLATRREFICYLVRNTPSSGTKAPRPRCDSSGRPLEFVSISPCELILIKWPKSPVVCIINIIAAEHSPGFYTRFQIHLSSRCFDLTQRNTHNITRGELSERPSQSLNMTSQEESNAAPPPPRPQRIGRYHCRLPTAIPTELMAFLRCTRQ